MAYRSNYYFPPGMLARAPGKKSIHHLSKFPPLTRYPSNTPSTGAAPIATQTLIIAYDVTDHRRRHRLHRLLGGFGEAIQKSVFLCHLTPTQRTRLAGVLARVELARDDRLDLFRITDHQPFGHPSHPDLLTEPTIAVLE